MKINTTEYHRTFSSIAANLFLLAITTMTAIPSRRPNETVVARTGQNIELLCEAYSFNDKVQFITPRNVKVSNFAPILEKKHSIEQDYDLFWKLVVRDALPNRDSGLYECRVNSKLVQVYNVTVQVPPRITNLTVFPLDEIYDSDDVIILCEATGDPMPSIVLMTYLSNGSSYETIEGPVIIIREMKRNGIQNVTCVVDNGLFVKDIRTITIDTIHSDVSGGLQIRRPKQKRIVSLQKPEKKEINGYHRSHKIYSKRKGIRKNRALKSPSSTIFNPLTYTAACFMLVFILQL
ncbi:hypothetical protein ACOME3_008742 [Neoechinorhynchus agilis]